MPATDAPDGARVVTGQGARPRAKVRIGDVARDAGVSAQTVSNVLNDRGRFAAETRDRVLAAVERTGYRPNRAARQLRTQRSHLLGVHVPAAHLSPRNTFSISFLREVIAAADRVDHQLVVFTMSMDDEHLAEGLAATGVDGFLLYNVGTADPRPQVFARLGVPFAVFGRLPPGQAPSWVDIDNAQAMHAVVDHLVARGHRTFGFVGYDDPEYWNHERLSGARARLAAHGLAFGEQWFVLGDFEQVEAAADRLLGPGRPDAIICSSDSLATVVHMLAVGRGLVPGVDVAITGFDGLPLPVELHPGLTSVVLPVAEVAAMLLQIVIGQVEGGPPPVSGRIVPTGLHIGGSA